MSYRDHFLHADAIVAHLNGLVPTLADPLLTVKYAGFVTVAAVTVYELAIKQILTEFAHKKHKVLGTFTDNYFARLNGRIKTKEMLERHLPNFGDKYVNKFRTRLDAAARAYLRAHRRDILSSYGNIITWRNEFAHEGRINVTATYSEAAQAYEDGKVVIDCLASAMVR